MLNLEELRLRNIQHLERERRSKVLVLAASVLDSEFLPHLYDVLTGIGKTERLDVVLYGRGGEINTARRIALLLHQFTENLCFLVPYHCQSSCTVLALAGHEVIAGDLATFSPIDPRLNMIDENGADGHGALDSENVRLFNEMCQNWFDLDIRQEETRMQLLASVASNIFPTTLTSLYRATKELQHIALELLTFQLPDNPGRRSEIVNQLLFGYHSHSYAITREDMLRIGLNIKRDEVVEALAWQIAKELNSVMGGGVRQTPEDPRNDVLLASCDAAYVRQRHIDHIAPKWHEIKLQS